MTTVFRGRDPQAAFRTAQRTRVSVGGKSVPAAAIAREMQNHEAGSPHEAWQSAARALVVRELLLQEAGRLGLRPEPREEDGLRETEEEALIRAVAETQVRTPEPDQSTCHRYYDKNRLRFRSPDLYEASHILLPAPPGDTSARAAAREVAITLRLELQRTPGTFPEFAARHSACPSAGVGGSLGQIRRGDTVPEIDTVLARLEPGETAGEPVETRYGFHIVRLDRRIAGRQLPFELVQERVATYLRERSRRLATAQYLAVLAARVGVEGIELPLPSELGAMHPAQPPATQEAQQ